MCIIHTCGGVGTAYISSATSREKSHYICVYLDIMCVCTHICAYSDLIIS